MVIILQSGQQTQKKQVMSMVVSKQWSSSLTEPPHRTGANSNKGKIEGFPLYTVIFTLELDKPQT